MVLHVLNYICFAKYSVDIVNVLKSIKQKYDDTKEVSPCMHILRIPLQHCCIQIDMIASVCIYSVCIQIYNCM